MARKRLQAGFVEDIGGRTCTEILCCNREMTNLSGGLCFLQ